MPENRRTQNGRGNVIPWVGRMNAAGNPPAKIKFPVAAAAWSEKACFLFCPAGLPVPVQIASLFLPVIDLFEKTRSARFQAPFRVFYNLLAVFLENHPVFGQITGRPVRI
jgi:hypothetical protein